MREESHSSQPALYLRITKGLNKSGTSTPELGHSPVELLIEHSKLAARISASSVGFHRRLPSLARGLAGVYPSLCRPPKLLVVPGDEGGETEAEFLHDRRLRL
jgi:hypothetical protein